MPIGGVQEGADRARAGWRVEPPSGYPPSTCKPEAANNHRNGKSGKTILTDDGPLRIEVPRDRDGSFEPVLIPKHERRFTGFDDKIIAMYARGMTMREVQGFLLESYGVEVSPEFISSVTDAIVAEVTGWQSRPLEPMYPVAFFDALRVMIREDAVVRNKAIYLTLGVARDGTRDILGLWIARVAFCRSSRSALKRTRRACFRRSLKGRRPLNRQARQS